MEVFRKNKFNTMVKEWNKDNEKYDKMYFLKYWFSYVLVIHEVKTIGYT